MNEPKLYRPLFTPGELEAITGISAATQRDWRRRGFLAKAEDGKHQRYELFSIAYLAALRHLIDAGLPVAEARLGASAAMNVVEHHAIRLDGITRRGSYPGGLASRYVVALRQGGTVRAGSLAELEKLLDEEPARRGAVFVVLDCEQIGRLIQERAGKPLSEFSVR